MRFVTLQKCSSLDFGTSTKLGVFGNCKAQKFTLTDEASVSVFAESIAKAICMALSTFPDSKRLSSSL